KIIVVIGRLAFIILIAIGEGTVAMKIAKIIIQKGCRSSGCSSLQKTIGFIHRPANTEFVIRDNKKIVAGHGRKSRSMKAVIFSCGKKGGAAYRIAANVGNPVLG